MKQSLKFLNNRHRTLYKLVNAHNIMINRFVELLKPFDISAPKFMLLRLLRHFHPDVITMRTLRENMLGNNSDVTRLVEKLAARELIHRQVNVGDKRIVEVSISEKGLDLLKQIDAVFPKNYYLGVLTEEQAEQLNFLLDIVIDSEKK